MKLDKIDRFGSLQATGRSSDRPNLEILHAELSQSAGATGTKLSKGATSAAGIT